MGHASRPHCLLVFDTCRLQRRRQGSLSLEHTAGHLSTNWSLYCLKLQMSTFKVIFDRMFLRWNSMFHRNLLSGTLAPQNAALSARNVGTDTADRTVSTHHLNIFKSQQVKFDLALNLSLLGFEQTCTSNLNLTAPLCELLVLSD